MERLLGLHGVGRVLFHNREKSLSLMGKNYDGEGRGDF